MTKKTWPSHLYLNHELFFLARVADLVPHFEEKKLGSASDFFEDPDLRSEQPDMHTPELFLINKYLEEKMAVIPTKNWIRVFFLNFFFCKR